MVTWLSLIKLARYIYKQVKLHLKMPYGEFFEREKKKNNGKSNQKSNLKQSHNNTLGSWLYHSLPLHNFAEGKYSWFREENKWNGWIRDTPKSLKFSSQKWKETVGYEIVLSRTLSSSKLNKNFPDQTTFTLFTLKIAILYNLHHN